MGKFLIHQVNIENMRISFIYINFSFSNINMSIGEGYKRNNNKEKGNRYCDHNMAWDDKTGTVLLIEFAASLNMGKNLS